MSYREDKPAEDLFFTDEHKALRQTIRQFCDKEVVPHVEEWEDQELVPNSIFRRAGELGLIGLRYPEEVGGQGWDYMAGVVRTEEFIRTGSFSFTMAIGMQAEMCTTPIEKFGTKEQIKNILMPAIQGEKIGCLGISEANAGSDVSGIETLARRDGNDWVINGSKMFITNGTRADFCTMVARTKPKGEGPKHGSFSLFLVDTHTPGFQVSKKLHKIGRTGSDTAELVFDNMRVPGDALLGEEGRGFQQIMWELQGERLVGAAMNVAGAQLAWDAAVKYGKERVQFGQPIGQFQAIRHKLADYASQIEAARQLVYTTCWKFGHGQYPTTLISMCKLLSAQVACEVTDYALQVHGSYGYMKEYPISRYWRDIRICRIGGGTDEVQRNIIAKELNI